MKVIHIRRKLESDTPHLPELKPLIGKNVEIIVVEDSTSTTRLEVSDSREIVSTLRGSVLRYDDPFEPAVPSDVWEANR
jgi:hypothetical protein